MIGDMGEANVGEYKNLIFVNAILLLFFNESW